MCVSGVLFVLCSCDAVSSCVSVMWFSVVCLVLCFGVVFQCWLFVKCVSDVFECCVRFCNFLFAC